MPRMRAVFCVIMLSHNTPERGALMVIPGTHKLFVSGATETPHNQLMKSSKYKIEAGATDQVIVTDLANQHGIQYCLGDVGTVAFLDINLLHGNHSNLSAWDRINMLPVYNGSQNKLEKPFSAPWVRRPEYIAARDPDNVKPIRTL
uniref:Uncharacterized protein LOC102802321 n=1 Tax=Saccoglossus kowalevskii TaxID=10224 RepID=A0ABM0MRV2_SACKO|nr:PREDICTED: uncharacterized protein LOC102802321 [Saccoglossus kowalevskii]